jgi:hypothetical protein
MKLKTFLRIRRTRRCLGVRTQSYPLGAARLYIIPTVPVQVTEVTPGGEALLIVDFWWLIEKPIRE